MVSGRFAWTRVQVHLDARLEARVALEELLTNAARLEPAGATERVTSLVFRGPTELPLRFV